MDKGNLSNTVQARALLVFEGALGHISGDAVEEFNALASRDAWNDAWACWSLNTLMAAKIWDVVRRQFIGVEIVTFVVPPEHSKAGAEGLNTFIELHNLPVSAVHAWSPDKLARELAYMPDIAAVYDANPETWAMFGRKGRALTNVNDFCRF
jgi:hypothetical protein